VTKATLTLHTNVSEGDSVAIHRVMRSWSEDTATWSSAAAAYDSAVEAELSRGSPGEPGVVSADLTGLGRSWVGGEGPNPGLLLRGATGSTSFATSESEIVTERPRLEVCFYTVP